MNWKELKEFANSIPEEDLAKNVILWREDEAITDIGVMALEEDHYIEEGDDGCYPLSDVNLTVDEAIEQGMKKVYSVGHPVMFENF